MNEQYVSFPQRPADDSTPAISKLYNSVHRRIQSIVSINQPSTTSTKESSAIDSVPDDKTSPTLASYLSNNSRDSKSSQDRNDNEATIGRLNAIQISENNRNRKHSPIVGEAHKKTSETNESRGTQPTALLGTAQKAAASIQTENLTVLGDVEYLDSPASTYSGNTTLPEEGINTNAVPGFALEREISSESETPSSPLHKRRPSFSREDSISTVLTRLKSGKMSKEFWMKDQNATSCFRCEAAFSGKLS